MLNITRSLHQNAGPSIRAVSAARFAFRPEGPLAVFGLTALTAAVLGRQWWLSHHPLPATRPMKSGMVAVVIPAYNEGGTIGDVIRRVPRKSLAEAGLGVNVIVVDDGSTDGTGDLARAAGAEYVVRHSMQRGNGAAVRSCLRMADELGACAAVYLDGDGEYDAQDIPSVLAPVIQGTADYVLGSRFPHGASKMCLTRRWGNYAFTALVSMLLGRRLRDGQTGFRAFSRRALEAAEIVHDYNAAQVLTLDLLRKGMRLAEVPIGYQTRRHGNSFIRYPEYVRRVVPAIARELLAP